MDGHTSRPASTAHKRRLWASFALVTPFFVVELVYGLVSGSLALVSDAGHMAADVMALGAALVAIALAARPDRTGRRTYGSYRAEVFASGFAVLLMLAAATYVLIEAVGRLGQPVEIATGPVLIVGAGGLLVNIICIVLLRRGASESLNVKGAYLEVMSDAAGSVGVMAAGFLVATTGQPVWDTVAAFAIAGFVAVRATVLAREVFTVLGQHAPRGWDSDTARRDLGVLPGVIDVHDLHAWTLTSGMTVATATLVIDRPQDAQAVTDAATVLLSKAHGAGHVTVQIDSGTNRTAQGWACPVHSAISAAV